MVNPVAEALAPFVWGRGGSRMSPEQIAREREIAEALGAVDTSPVGHWLPGAARMANAAVGRMREGRASSAEQANSTASQERIGNMLSSLGAPTGSSPVAEALIGSTAPVQPVNQSGNEIFSSFMDTVKEGVTNPYALAAIAATGQRESAFSPGNVNRTWSDPSESGQAGTAGGIMSWRGPRYQALAQTGDLSPAGQARFFLQEDPSLISALNGAQSVEDAIGLMNNAWKFAGYDRPGGEAAARLQAAQGFLPQFQGSAKAPARAAVNTLGAAQPVGVAETEADIIAQEAAMAGQDPMAFQQPQSPRADVAASLTSRPIADPALPMAGNTSGFAPVQAAQAGGINPAIIEALSSPYSSGQEREIAQLLLGQQMQAQDPMQQLEMQLAQEKLNQMRNPVAEPTDTMRNLEWRAAQAGLQPGTPEYQQFMATGGGKEGVTVNNIMGGEKFGEEFAKGDAQALAAVSEAGLSAQRNVARINRLGDLLAQTPQGAMASWQQLAGQYGINTDGLSNIQAAQALINSLVPEQRPAGSGPMSDADLELFKQSLPRIINQPGGNEMIVNTMRAVAQYDAEGANIVQALRRGEIDRAQAFEALQARQNPLANLDDIITPSNAPKRREINGYVIEQVD